MSKNGTTQTKSLESWIWDAACSIHGAKDASKYKDYILPLIFLKRLCDVYDDEINRIATNVGNRSKAFELIERDRKLVRFYLPFKPANLETDEVWSVIRNLSNKIGEQLTTALRDVARENPSVSGIINRVDFNATVHGQRDIDDDRLSNLIERVSEKRLGLKDVEPDIIGRSYEYLIRKFAENSGKSAGEFYTPKEVSIIMAHIMSPEPGMEIYDPTCGSAGLLISCQEVLDQSTPRDKRTAPLKLYGQEYTSDTWAMAKMNMIVHDLEGDIEIGDTMKSPKFVENGKIKKFDRVVANPMWNQGKDELPYISEEFFINDPYNRFLPDNPNNADWAWVEHIVSSLKENGKAAVVLDTGAASRGSGNNNTDKEKNIRKWFIQNDLVEAVILLPEDIFYNTPNQGIIVVFNKEKKHNGEVLMIDISESYVKKRPKNELTKIGITTVVSRYGEWQSLKDYSKVVTTEKIEQEDFNLLPTRYIEYSIDENWEKDFKNRFQSDGRNFKKNLSFIFLLDLFNKLIKESNATDEKNITSKLDEWKLVELKEILTPSELVFSETEYKKESTPVLSLTKEWGLIDQAQRFGFAVAREDISNYKIAKKGWLVYNPMVIWEGAIHILHEPEFGVVSPAYEVLIPNDIDTVYLDYILKTSILLNDYKRLSAGGVKRRRIVNLNDFLKILIPVPVGKEKIKITNALQVISSSFDKDLEKLIKQGLDIVDGK